MSLSVLDWSIIAFYFLASLLIGLWAARSNGTADFFLSGRKMSGWLLGVSLVATTFSADTPNLVTDIVRQNGVAGNWVWWAMLLTGMMTVFFFARLWRRSAVLTDLEFYELRYSGRLAGWLRGFRAVYLGLMVNVLIMGSVSLAAIKIAGVLLGTTPVQTVVVATLVTVLYSAKGGFRSVVITDAFQFGFAMFGAVVAAYYIVNLPQVGGLSALLKHEAVAPKLNMLPSSASSGELWWSVLLLPLLVQWWSSWYPGAEPGGGGYVAQRMLAAKDEQNALGATLLFNIMHYALRPWPWILVALASLVVYPDLASLQQAFPRLDARFIGHDLAYPAMISLLPGGLLGLLLASLAAAYMSTISTHLNWGASYIVNDFWKRFAAPQATEKELVAVGRAATVLLGFVSALVALSLQNAKQSFDLILQVGAGTGLLFILRWFWWRINAYSELSAMAISFAVACFFTFFYDDWFPNNPVGMLKLPLSVAITTLGWLVVTLLTPPDDAGTLQNFYNRIRPGGWGWQRFAGKNTNQQSLTAPLVGMLSGCGLVYATLFGIGQLLYGQWLWTGLCALCALVCGWIMRRVLKNISLMD
jgi:Na+/proline symporter